MAKNIESKKTPVLAVLNMKGGVGKTTIAANVMRLLYKQFSKRTILVDFDPQFNLTQLLYTQDKYEKLKNEKRTILSIMESEPETSLFKVTSLALLLLS